MKMTLKAYPNQPSTLTSFSGAGPVKRLASVAVPLLRRPRRHLEYSPVVAATALKFDAETTLGPATPQLPDAAVPACAVAITAAAFPAFPLDGGARMLAVADEEEDDLDEEDDDLDEDDEDEDEDLDDEDEDEDDEDFDDDEDDLDDEDEDDDDLDDEEEEDE